MCAISLEHSIKTSRKATIVHKEHRSASQDTVLSHVTCHYLHVLIILIFQVSKLAGVLSSHGVGRGDRVLIYMPMIPQAIVTMLATARLGAIHSLQFGGFAPKQLAPRINHTEV